jgi:Fe2+ transport system protein FeoA
VGHVADLGGEGDGGGDGDLWLQLSQYGLLPGTPICLTRKYPVPIVRVGQTDLALDRAIAARIYVDI